MVWTCPENERRSHGWDSLGRRKTGRLNKADDRDTIQLVVKDNLTKLAQVSYTVCEI